VPLIFLGVMLFVFVAEWVSGVSFSTYGIHPRDWVGLRGLLFSPFIHGSWEHLFNNSIPLLVLGTSLFYFYRPVAWYVWLYGWFISGLWVWVVGRSSFHIGASGLVYVLAFFLFFSGVFNRNMRMMGISLLVAFLYGSMVWGIFPIEDGVSWESHLFGGALGLAMAYVFRLDGPQRKKYNLDEGIDELEERFGEEYWNKPPELHSGARPLRIRYIFKPRTRENSVQEKSPEN